jgi:serine/threonine protein kinase
MAPELFRVATRAGLDDYSFSPKVDIWGLGATLYNMVVGHPPWIAENQLHLAHKVQNFEVHFPIECDSSLDPHLKNLIKRMLAKDPIDRPDMVQYMLILLIYLIFIL